MSPEEPLPPTNHLAIETHDLRKVFGSKVAVRGLSLQVRRGEIFGFLGPNGAGKSTAIKMLLGLVKPTSGHAQILDQPFSSVEVRRKIGFLPEDFRFYDWLTAPELLTLHGRLCGLTRHNSTTAFPPSSTSSDLWLIASDASGVFRKA